MSTTGRIAGVLAEHQWYDASCMEADEPAVGCTGCDDWFGNEDALGDGTFAAHQAAQLAPLIVELEREAMRHVLGAASHMFERDPSVMAEGGRPGPLVAAVLQARAEEIV